MPFTSSTNGVLLSGEATVAAAGTAEPIGSRLVRAFTIIGKAGNTGQIYLGGADVDNTVNDGIDANQVSEWGTVAHEYDLSTIYIDADVNGEGVDVYATI